MKKVLIITITVFLLCQCSSLKPKIVRPQSGKSMLYAARYDSLVSMGDKIQIHLNGKKVAVMNKSDSYIAVQTPPRTYKVRFVIYNSSGKRVEKEERGFDLRMEAGKTYYTNLKYLLGWKYGTSTVSETGFSGAVMKTFLGVYNAE